MRTIDINNWSRKEHFLFFRQMDYPHFNLCGNVDLTLTQNWLQKQDISFFKAMVYIAMRALHDIPEFRYRIRGEEVVEHELVHPAFTMMRNDGVFTFCPVQYQHDFQGFYGEATRQIELRKVGKELGDEPERDDRVFISSIPWVSFTGLSHPVHMHPVDSIPRITWGKYFEEQGRVRLPLSVQVNHAIMDGYHVGLYFTKIQEYLDQPENILQL